MLISRFKKILQSSDPRTKNVKKNIVLLFVNKFLSAFISLQLIPATIGYVDASQYGIWIAISSLVSWMVYFDFGLTHGFRNGFTTAKANGNFILAKQYLATSYAILTIIFMSLLVTCLIINKFISWSVILGVDSSLNSILRDVFTLIVIFFSIQMIFNLLTTFLLADQRPAFSAMIVTIGQFFSLVVVYLLTFHSNGSLLKLAFALIGIPTISLILLTFILFKTKFKEYIPSFHNINWSLFKDILGLGSKFFIIQLSMLFVFQFANFIIIRVMGAEAVTNYTIVYRYFSVIFIIMGIVFVPFWSAFTEAYAKKELSWMTKTYYKLSKIWTLTFLLYFSLLFLSPYVYNYWLAKNLNIDYKLSIAMGINMIILSRANLYMLCLNGIGKVYVQMIIYLVFAVISIPLMYYFTKIWGYYGVITVSSLVYLCQAIIGHFQLKMILKGNENGIWSK